MLLLKCACTKAVKTPIASPKLEELADKQRIITTITNNNCCTKQDCIKAYKAALVERSLNLSLIALDKQVANNKRSAYAAILVKNKEVIA